MKKKWVNKFFLKFHPELIKKLQYIRFACSSLACFMEDILKNSWLKCWVLLDIYLSLLIIKIIIIIALKSQTIVHNYIFSIIHFVLLKK